MKNTKEACGHCGCERVTKDEANLFWCDHCGKSTHGSVVKTGKPKSPALPLDIAIKHIDNLEKTREKFAQVIADRNKDISHLVSENQKLKDKSKTDNIWFFTVCGLNIVIYILILILTP